MLQKLASISTRWSTRWVPDAWVIAVILTIVAYFLGLFFTKSTAYQLIQHWGNGFWVLHTFGMQMCLIIMTGYILATTPIFSRMLNALAGLPKSPKGCIALMAIVSMGLAWINWGLSIVGSAVFVRFMVKKQRGVDYRLLVATAYLGLGTFWHSGLSASAPLLVATPKHFLEKDIGIIPITETIFHPFNLLLALAVLIFMTIIGPMMHPKKGEEKEADPKLVEEAAFEPPCCPTGGADPGFEDRALAADQHDRRALRGDLALLVFQQERFCRDQPGRGQLHVPDHRRDPPPDAGFLPQGRL